MKKSVKGLLLLLVLVLILVEGSIIVCIGREIKR